MKHYLIISLVGTVFLFVACQRHTKPHSLLFLGANTLNIDSIIGVDRKVIDIKVTNDTAIVRLKGNNNGSGEFVLIDLKKGNILSRKRISELEGIIFDYLNGRLIYLSMVRPDLLYQWRAGSNKVITYKLDEQGVFSSTDVIQNRTQTFFIGNLYRVSLMKNNNADFFLKGNLNGALNEIANTISIPVSDTLNVLSGGVTGPNSGYLLAIDNSNSIRWRIKTNIVKSRNKLQIFNYSNFFLVCNDYSVYVLRKSDGSTTFEKTFNKEINKVLASGDQVAIVFLSNNQIFSPISLNHKLSVVSLKIPEFKLELSYEAKLRGDVNIALSNDKLILTDENTYQVFSINEKKVLKKISFSPNESKIYRFKNILDSHTLKSYRYSYNGMLCW
ncbi:hypothetical protein C8P68_105288 [Mucilaginibacter yixingensis]|uniref:Lipoprotein n=1 Tax=Mucilaginibacter yixingensis TaxID=1295612 RepID=A0A2T5J8I8_9SPHI|nr:hypothetical protein [Mucilaginibacter yixingensis]PTQ95778.1 hypothetical protein C8P68_105288 [Mucilaginibacter yixingensis]